MPHTTPDDFDPQPSHAQGHEDKIIDPTISPSDQPALTAEEETNFSPYQSNLATGEETGTPLSPEDLLPPEARGEVHGGPLGCCLGVTVGLFLSLPIAVLSRLYSDPISVFFQHNYGLMGVLIRILMGILAVAFALLCGRFGWKLGKRFYREYEPPPLKKRKKRSKLQHQNS